MRILMWFTIGFAMACGLSIYLGIGLWLCIVIGVAAASLFLIKKRETNIVAVILVGITAGFLWTSLFDYFCLNAARSYDGATIDTTAVVSDYSFNSTFGVAADAKTEIKGRAYNVRLYCPLDVELNPGDRITGQFRFRMTTDDSAQGGTYHQGDGIFLLAYVSDEATITPGESNAPRYLGVRIRKSISDRIRELFSEDTFAFATALILGDSSELDYETDTDFKVSGIRHVIAVSGLHVSILMAVVYLFSGRRRFLSALIGLPLLLIFAAIVGFTPSVIRACIMQALVLLALLLNQDYDSPTALSFAVLVMLAINPMTITSVSFQLSCGCIVGILLFYERISGYLYRLFKVEKGKTKKARFLRGICAGVAITVSTTITTMPLSAMYFGAVSIVSVLTNLLTLWVISIVFWGIGICCAISYVFMPLAKGIAWLVSLLLRYVIGTADIMARLPFSAVYTCSIYIVIWLVLCYAILFVLILSKKKRPLIAATCVLVGLIAAVALSWMKPNNSQYQVTVFDVGQGQSVLIESDGRRYLVDCGGDSPAMAADTVSQNLLSRGITRLDGIVLTHYDIDHAGAVPLLLTRVRADAIYLPDMEDTGTIKEQLITGDNVLLISQLTQLEFEGNKLTLIPSGDTAKNDNERSLCILFQREKCDILITGDRAASGEKELMKKVRLPELELLVVGHHGSKTSTGFELLKTARPKAAVISVGRDNYHGHPSKEVLHKLKLFGCKVHRTDVEGTLIFKG